VRRGVRRSSADRSVSPAIAVILLVAIVVVLAAALTASLSGLAGDVSQPTPTVVAEAEFEARDDLDPHWIFRIEHVGGDSVAAGELTVRLIGSPDGGTAENTYTGSFETGDTLRVGLWGWTKRADADTCEVMPEPAPGHRSSQLDGWEESEHDTEVRIVLIHESSDSVMDRLRIDLSTMPRRFEGDQRHYIAPGAEPSFNCGNSPESEW
jgi:flagellin-like protein